MKTHDQTTGVAVLCDQQGRIIEVIRDELGLEERIASGQSFPRLVDQANMKKSLNFLVELRSQGAVFG